MHLAVPPMHKKLNKHSLNMKIQKVTEDKVRPPRVHNTLICCSGAQPVL